MGTIEANITKILNKIISPAGIILIDLFVIFLWFKNGLLFAGAEDQLLFFNLTRSLNLISNIWHSVGIGFPSLPALPATSILLVLEPIYKLGVSNVLLEAILFYLLVLLGMLSVYYLIEITICDDYRGDQRKLLPFLAAIFYFLNPFSLTQIWGRSLWFQFFSFALIPMFLLFFVLSLQKKNLIFCLIAAVCSFLLSAAYTSPSSVITSWASVIIYLIYYLLINRNKPKNILLACYSFTLILVTWLLINYFWIYPIIKHGGEMLAEKLIIKDLGMNVNLYTLIALAPQMSLDKVIRLIHKGYYDGTYGPFYNGNLIMVLSWFLPLFALLSIPVLRRMSHFLFYFFLFVVSTIVSIGANLPTGGILIWLFERVPLLQVLRNPYEKFGINLVLAYTPFFAIGILVFCNKLAKIYKNEKAIYFLVAIFTFLFCVVLVGPIWKGNFAGGVKTNLWVKVPDYYKEANSWLNSQKGDFTILHLPLNPGEGIAYKWKHPYEGIDPSEFLFDRLSIARESGYNKVYSTLMKGFGVIRDKSEIEKKTDLDSANIIEELDKLNIRYIILHSDIDYEFVKSASTEQTKILLNAQKGINKVNQFGKLEIYKVDIPENINRIYSPQIKVDYKKINNSYYIVNVKDAQEPIDLYLLQQFHPSWEAFIEGERIKSHTEVFSYANKWSINKLGNYQVQIRFIQQDAVELGIKISFITFGVLVLILLVYLLKIRKPLF